MTIAKCDRSVTPVNQNLHSVARFRDSAAKLGHVNSVPTLAAPALPSWSRRTWLIHFPPTRKLTPMIKRFAFASIALFGFASPSFAWQPYFNTPISDAPSVLVRTESPIDSAPPIPVGVEMSSDHAAKGSSTIEQSPMPLESAPLSEDGTPIESVAPVAEGSAPVYRTVRQAPRSSGVFGNLIELERRKNAWLRRTFSGR